MTSPGEITLDYRQLEAGLCLNYGNTDKERVQIECNWCSEHDYVFLDSGWEDSLGDESNLGWLGRAAVHLTKYHTSQLAELAKTL